MTYLGSCIGVIGGAALGAVGGVLVEHNSSIAYICAGIIEETYQRVVHGRTFSVESERNKKIIASIGGAALGAIIGKLAMNALFGT